MRRVGLAAAAIIFVGQAAAAQPTSAPACAAPGPTPADSERPAPMPPQPKMPKCIDPRTLLAHCSEEVTDAYRDAVQAYNTQVRLHATQDQAFVDHLKAWDEQVRDYAQCELNALNGENEGR